MSNRKISVFALYPDTFEKHLSENIEAFSKFQPLLRTALASLVWVNISSPKRYQHKLDQTCFSVPAKLLNDRLGEKYLDHMLATGLFEVGIEYDPRCQTTRGYRLTNLAHDNLESYEAKDLEQTSLIDKSRNNVRVGKNAIRSKDNKGNNTKFKGQIPQLISINLAGTNIVQASLDVVRDMIYRNIQPIELSDMDNVLHERFMKYVNGTGGKKIENMEKAFQSYQALLSQINIIARVTNRPTGMIPCTYTEIKTGRIYGEGINPQTWPRELRKAAFPGQYDFDFENCHYAIFSQLAKRENKQTPSINDYLARKEEVRQLLADDIGVSEDDMKQCLIALIYGARLTVWAGDDKRKANAITNIIGAEKAGKLFLNPLYRNIKGDINKCRESILRAHMKSQGLVNAMGKALPLKIQLNKDGNKEREVDSLSHILQGYESKMLETVVLLHGKSITVLQHDGWTSADGNICLDNISSRIKVKTGLVMKISREQIPYHQTA
jgi:hypothetical protein